MAVSRHRQRTSSLAVTVAQSSIVSILRHNAIGLHSRARLQGTLAAPAANRQRSPDVQRAFDQDEDTPINLANLCKTNAILRNSPGLLQHFAYRTEFRTCSRPRRTEWTSQSNGFGVLSNSSNGAALLLSAVQRRSKLAA